VFVYTKTSVEIFRAGGFHGKIDGDETLFILAVSRPSVGWNMLEKEEISFQCSQ